MYGNRCPNGLQECYRNLRTFLPQLSKEVIATKVTPRGNSPLKNLGAAGSDYQNFFGPSSFLIVPSIPPQVTLSEGELGCTF